MQTENLSHSAVEIQLPLDGNHYHCVIPPETTLFFWRALIPGTGDGPAPIDSIGMSTQSSLESELRDRVSWSVSLDGETIPLLSDLYRNAGCRGVGWWSVTDAVELPAVLSIEFATTGEPPSIERQPSVWWTDEGRKTPWNGPISTTVDLQSPTNSSHEFENDCEGLWNRHQMHQPVRKER